MRAMVLEQVGSPLVLKNIDRPMPKSFEVLLRVSVCGVCRTDLHIVDGELAHPKLPLILGHQIVGVVAQLGDGVTKWQIGDRVGAFWLGSSCHKCEFCLTERENLCDYATFNGYQRDGGYAEFCCLHQDYILPLSEKYDDVHTAPMLCAGFIGYRALRLAGPAKTMGFYGFGSSAHLLIQIANSLGREIYVFTRPGDEKNQAFARELGAKWAGGSDQLPPVALDAALIFAPVGALYPQALKAVKKGGKVISAGIHMSDIPAFPYALLWEERSMSSVANLTRQDGIEFLQAIANIQLQIAVTVFKLEDANQALETVRKGAVEGSVVLKV